MPRQVRLVVDSLAQVEFILGAISSRISDWRPVWKRAEEDYLPDSQKRWWDQRFNKALIHAPGTVKARRKRQGYYKNSRGDRATDSGPYLEWTGGLREATEQFNRKGDVFAEIKPDLLYKGPIRANLGGKVVSTLLERRGVLAWNPQAVERAIEKAADDWLERDVLTGLRFSP